VLVDPLDVDSIADGIREAIDGRASLRDRGLVRAGHFSWDDTAQRTLQAYEEAAA
jgi:glycosyltransferase involved in cell wall biosynthesis